MNNKKASLKKPEVITENGIEYFKKDNKKYRIDKPPELDNIKDKILRIISGEEGFASLINEVANKLGDYYAAVTYKWDDKKGKLDEVKPLSRSQIRAILDRFQRPDLVIEDKETGKKRLNKDKIELIRPLLAYAAGRHGGKVKHFQEVMEYSIQKVDSLSKFQNLRNFVEAIVAYHRYHGGD